MRSFTRRSSDEEIMDNLECNGEVVFQTLRELEIINRLLGGNHVTIDGVAQLLKHQQDRSITVADIGCGGGDILKLVSHWGKINKKPFHLYGMDANPHIIDFARTNTSKEFQINYEALNVFSAEFQKRKFDVILATLFLHHFPDKQLIELLTSLKGQARRGIVINDLHRHWIAYYSIRLLTLFFSRSAMVKFDAPLSVLRAFTRRDWEAILKAAGINSYSLRWKWAFRWQLVIPSTVN